MTWDGKRIWLARRKDSMLYAVSPADGKVETTLKLEFKEVAGIGWWDDSLLVTRDKAKLLLWVDPKTGRSRRTVNLKQMEWIGDPVRVGNEVRITDHIMGCFRSLNPDEPAKLGWRGIAGAITDRACSTGDAIWHIDAWTPTIIKSDLRGRLLDWGEKPFVGSVDGLAWDGERLWALDNQQKRICVIEKSVQSRDMAGELP